MTDYNMMKDFTFGSRDEFTRKPIAEKIIKLLDSDIDVSPLIIDGKWGTGKTEFCFKLKNLIESNNTNDYKVGYVNAFQADHTNEPLLTLISEIVSFYPKKSYQRKKLIKNAIPYLRLVGGIGLKAGLGFAFGRYAADIPEELSKGMETIEEGSKELIDLSLESLIEDQAEAERSLNTLKNVLTDITAENPVILLIDELDRCRPDFAVMMLETIKHVFDVENVQIILVTNADQLKATIKHSYGSETNSHDYLYKFFKYQFNLPTSAKDTEGKSIENNVTHFKTVVRDSKVIPQTFKNNEFLYDISKFVKVAHLSLRKIEQVVRCIETLIVFEDKEKSQQVIAEQTIIVLLSFIYIAREDLFINLINKEILASDFLEFINSDVWHFPMDSRVLSLNIAKVFILLVFKNIVRNQLFSTINSPEGILAQVAKEVMRRMGIEDLSINDNGISPDSYLYDYIDHTINNLSLLNIVK